MSNQVRMVTALTGIRANQESLQLNNPYLLIVLVPFNHCLSYINHIQYNSVTRFPSALVLISEFAIPGEGLTQFLVYYKYVLDRSGWYHVWHHPEITIS